MRSSEPSAIRHMDSSTGLPSASGRPVPTSPSQPVDTASVPAAVVHNLIAASGRAAVSGNVGWPPASSGAIAAPAPESYVPSVNLPQKRAFPGHFANKAQRSTQIPGWSPTHVFTDEVIVIALQKLFVIVQQHAGLIYNLSVEAGCLNSSINPCANDAYNNSNHGEPAEG